MWACDAGRLKSPLAHEGLKNFPNFKNFIKFKKLQNHKKVLLHECKRHTAHNVANAYYGGGEGGTPSSHVGGVFHPVMVGGYSIQSWWGYPFQSWWGVPHPVMQWRVPWVPPHYPDLAAGVPHQVMGVPQVPPTIQTWLGGTPSSHGGGYPRYPLPSRPMKGYPPPHHPDLGWGTPHHPDLRWGTPTIQTWDRVPPHHPDLGWGTPQKLNRQTPVKT